jgi:hypothetical protein
LVLRLKVNQSDMPRTLNDMDARKHILFEYSIYVSKIYDDTHRFNYVLYNYKAKVTRLPVQVA